MEISYRRKRFIHIYYVMFGSSFSNLKKKKNKNPFALSIKSVGYFGSIIAQLKWSLIYMARPRPLKHVITHPFHERSVELHKKNCRGGRRTLIDFTVENSRKIECCTICWISGLDIYKYLLQKRFFFFIGVLTPMNKCHSGFLRDF